jgi:GNAT superfamily N-acetyltransferase
VPVRQLRLSLDGNHDVVLLALAARDSDDCGRLASKVSEVAFQSGHEDWTAVLELAHLFVDASNAHGEQWTPGSALRHFLLDYVRRESGLVWVAEDQTGRVVGGAMVGTEVTPTGRRFHGGEFFVATTAPHSRMRAGGDGAARTHDRAGGDSPEALADGSMGDIGESLLRAVVGHGIRFGFDEHWDLGLVRPVPSTTTDPSNAIKLQQAGRVNEWWAQRGATARRSKSKLMSADLSSVHKGAEEAAQRGQRRRAQRSIDIDVLVQPADFQNDSLQLAKVLIRAEPRRLWTPVAAASYIEQNLGPGFNGIKLAATLCGHPGGGPIGFMHAQAVYGDTGRSLTAPRVVVAPGFQHLGVASELIAEAARRGSELGFTTVSAGMPRRSKRFRHLMTALDMTDDPHTHSIGANIYALASTLGLNARALPIRVPEMLQ